MGSPGARRKRYSESLSESLYYNLISSNITLDPFLVLHGNQDLMFATFPFP